MAPRVADESFMRAALGLARRGLGQTWPNPAVGCLIVQAGRIVGRGWTRPGGRPHAEVTALAQAGGLARGATAYVTLEPCAHHGKTPPCVEALVAAGIERVVVACGDPDPRVSGRGIAFLRAAGIQLVEGVLAEEAEALNQGFLTRIHQGRPLLWLKLATSFDGRIATASGHSQWITGPDARRHVHSLRAQFDAVMVGGGTARADDPSLTVRDLGVAAQPLRVVWSRRLDLPQRGKLAQSARDVPLWILCGDSLAPALRQRWEDLGAKLLPVGVTRDGQLDAALALQALGQAGLTRIFCEGGGALAASLMAAGLVDGLVGYTAGLAIGAEGQPGFGALGLERLEGAPRFTLVEQRALGPDLYHRWAPLSAPEPGIA